MIQIDEFELTNKTLILNYSVSNHFTDDVWVCETGFVNGVEDAATRIVDETVWIKRRSRIETNFIVMVNPEGITKYLRILPGETHSGRITLNLPIMKVPDGVHGLERERARKRKKIVLNRAVLEVGYFDSKYGQLFLEASERMKKNSGIEDDDMSVIDPISGLRIDPFVVNQLHGDRSFQVLYIGANSPSDKFEQSATSVITDVSIPCSVRFDESAYQVDNP